LGNRKTDEYWLNEINTIPGSFAYFLWADASKPATYQDLSDALIREGFKAFKNRQRETSSNVGNSTIFN
jgi:D-alanine-D-alanine ligase